MIKVKAFLMAEGMTALLVSLLSLSLFFLVVGEGKKVEVNLEQKTDRAYAKHVIQEQHLEKVEVHDHIYQKQDFQ